MSKTTTKPAEATPEQDQPRYVLGAGSDGFLLPDGLSCTPSEVQVLNDEAVRAHAAMVLAGTQVRAARDEAKRARPIGSTGLIIRQDLGTGRSAHAVPLAAERDVAP